MSNTTRFLHYLIIQWWDSTFVGNGDVPLFPVICKYKGKIYSINTNNIFSGDDDDDDDDVVLT